jgi:hypothetical protein
VSAEEEPRREIFIVSDGTGETAAAAVRAAMTQFPASWRLRTWSDVRSELQVRRIMEQASAGGAAVVFTLVDEHLARAMQEQAEARGVLSVDLLGPLISTLAEQCGLRPQVRPGLLHGFGAEYLRRVDAVEFAVRHDDGANLHTLFQADLVLVGPSRTSKTPLSMYLAQRGYKTGNLPLLPGLEVPQVLVELDRRKVFGLTVAPETLITVRRARMRTLGASPYLAYADPEAVIDELRRSRRLFRECGWRTVDITGRAVEENAARILELYER